MAYSTYGLPSKSGVEEISNEDWDLMASFISSKLWWRKDPCLESDKRDPLVGPELPFGSFMLGFDFHLTEEGVKLIEINTNAGGLAVTHSLIDESGDPCKKIQKRLLEQVFVEQLVKEFRTGVQYFGTPGRVLHHVAIVDERVNEQLLYPEMVVFAELLRSEGLEVSILSPHDLTIDEEGVLWTAASSQPIDFLYNRLTDFRLTEVSNEHIRQAALAQTVVLSPHPAAYARIADKRNLVILGEELRTKASSGEVPEGFGGIIPRTLFMNERTTEEWVAARKKWVFKPPAGNGSRGVYRGDRISVKKLKELPPAHTLAQEMCSPSVSSEDGTKLDFRVFTSGTAILGLATRHYSGQVMEMRSAKSGFKMALPPKACCMPALVDFEDMLPELVC